MLDWLTSLFSNKAVLPALISGGTMLYGSKLASDANSRAAASALQGQREANAAIIQGNNLAQERFNQAQQQTAPGTTYLRSLVSADPNVLSPSQQRQLDTLRRTTGAQLAASGLRGAGRAVTKSIRDVESDYTSRAIDSNRARSDMAAGNLSGQYFNAGNNSANASVNTGNAIGQGALNTAGTVANADIATAATQGQTLGAVASIFANANKEEERKSKYNTTQTIGEGAK